MSVKVPIRTVFDGSTAIGLAEYQSGEFIGLTHGGLGASLSIGSAGQILKVNSGASALEFGAVEAIVDIDNATDLTARTLVVGDKLLASDNGTEGKIELSQLDTLFSGTSKTLTNKTLTAPTITGTAVMADLDISGDVDVDGTLEADAITVAGVALSTVIRDAVGNNMLSSNTESGITVTYDTSNDNIDFAINAAQTGITSILATDLKIGEDDQTKIDFETADEIHFYAANAEQVYVADGIFGPQTDSDVDLGTTGVRWKDAFIDTITTTGTITAGGVVTGTGFTAGNAVIAEAELELLDGLTAGTAIASKVVTTDSSKDTTGQRNLTITGELDAASLTVDDIGVNGKIITMTGSSSDTAVFTAGTNGTLDIVTTDAGGAAANIQITADGTAELAGTTVTLDSSGGITLDADSGTITFADAGSSLGTITSSGYSGTSALATTAVVSDSTSNTNFPVVFHDESNALLDDTGALRYNPSTGTLLVPNLSVAGTTTTVDTVTMEAENAIVFEGATADAHETTLTIVDPTADRTINLPNQSGTVPVLAAASNTAVTSTPEELNILDGATVVVGEINALDLGSTAVGTAIASKAVILDSNKDYTGIRNFTVTGELDAATGDFSSDVDIDGDLLVGDDLTLDSDAAVLGFGANKDVTITHVHDTGVLLNDAMVVQFRDSAINIGSPADGDLDINADDEIELNSTLIDINGNVEISGTTAQVGVSTSTAKDVFNAGMSVKNGATGAGFVEFFEDSDNGTNKVTLIGPASTGDVTLTLPSATGTLATTTSASDDAVALSIALG
jgi:hypothetical protein